MKKRLIALFAFVLIVAGICFLNEGGSKVQATETAEVYTENDDFVSVYYEEIKGHRGSTYTKPDSPVGYEDYLFAGWYSAKECGEEKALDSSTKDGEAWAKFVPSGVLSVKAQLAQKDNGNYNMRIISSLDTLDYAAVGFNVEYGEGKKIPIPIKEVYTRIKATAESGVGYNYSPKVVDTKSEYFMTATLANIGVDKTDVEFNVIPYWRTLDGTMVYGVNRYVAVDDGLNDVISFTVKKDAVDLTNLFVKDSGNNAIEDVDCRQEEKYDYATVTVAGQGKITLPSATKYVITDGTDSVDVVYRNLETTHKIKDSTDINADKTWYTVDTSKDEYVIATSADLYGFSALVDEYNFNGDTIYVIADITVNTNDVTKEVGTYSWDPIGNDEQFFSGVFDAQMHTISGLYVNSSSTHVGLFAWVKDCESAVKNIRLMNSYFCGTGSVGSVAGVSGGLIDTVYSEAIVVNKAAMTGGIVGQVNIVSDTKTEKVVINNCWVANDVITEHTKAAYYRTGGIVGYVQKNVPLDITNCFVEGDVIARYASQFASGTTLTVGGFCGESANDVSIKNCLLKGSVQALYNDAEQGYTKDANATVYLYNALNCKGVTTTLEEVFAMAPTGSSAIKNNSGTVTWNGHDADVTTSEISGTSAYSLVANKVVGAHKGKLNYYTSENTTGEWIIRENDVPGLKSFVNDGIDVAWYYDSADSDSFTISTEEELYGLSALSADLTFEGKTINLGADIKVNNGIASEWADGKSTDGIREWTPISRNGGIPFQGTFNGNGHVLEGIYLNYNGTGYAGLFGATQNCVIKNFKLSESCFTNVDSAVPASMGCVVGSGNGGTFVNIYCDDKVVLCTNNCVIIGGIIARVAHTSAAKTNCTVNNCWFGGKLNADISVKDSNIRTGGIVGYQIAGTTKIDNCLFTGNIDVKAVITAPTKNRTLQVGGLMGGKEKGDISDQSGAIAFISNSISSGSFDYISITKPETDTTNYKAYAEAGAIFGYASSTTGESYSNVYATKECYSHALGNYSNDELPNEVRYVPATELCGKVADLDDKYLWQSFDNDTPKLRYYLGIVPANCEWYVESIGDAADPYVIADASELDAVASMTNSGVSFAGKTITLANDITYNEGTENYTEIAQWEAAEGLKMWTPIGTADNSFQGTFDGNDYSIKGIYANYNNLTHVGLFGYVGEGAILKNFNIENGCFIQNTATGAYLGTIAAVFNGSEASSIYATNVVTGGDAQYTGGLFAEVGTDEP